METMAKPNYRELMELLFSVYGILHSGVFRPGKAGEELGRTEFGLLCMLDRKGSLSPSEAAESLGISRPQMSAIVDRLVLRDILVRGSVEGDRRASRIDLTDEGRAILREALDATEARVTELLSPLEGGEVQSLAQSLRTLVTALGKKGKEETGTTS
jgi:Transcriptional regulators